MIATKLIRIVIADDHDLLRSGLAVFLMAFPDMQLVGEASNGKEAIEVCESVKPDVLLIDLHMPVMDGIRAIQHLRRSLQNTRIVVLTNFVEEELVQDALASGAISYLLKSVTADELAGAIRDAAYHAKGRLAAEVTQALVSVIQRPPAPEIHLTVREREVLRLLVLGKTNREIAEQLVIAVPTVKRHVSSILAKFNTDSRTEVLVKATQYRILEE